MQPIRTQERRCIHVHDGIVLSLSIARCAYFAFKIVLATVFPVVWREILIQRFLVLYHVISHLLLVFFRSINTPMNNVGYFMVYHSRALHDFYVMF